MGAAAFGPQRARPAPRRARPSACCGGRTSPAAACRTRRASPNGRRRARASSSSMRVERALEACRLVRSGPTSSAMVACRRCSISAVLGMSFGGSLRIRSTVARAAPFAAGTDFIAFARAAAVRPAWRPNTNASVMALPESRFAPFAPPTASPATSRPGTLGLHLHVGRDAAHVIVRDRRHLDRHLGEVDAVLRQPVDHRPERLAQLLRRHVLEAQIGAAVRRAAAGLDLLDDGVGGDVAGDDVFAVLRHAVAVGELLACPC